MQFEVKEIDSIKRHLLVTVPSDDLQKIEGEILKDVSKSVSLPGFRKGRAPIGLIKKNYADFIRKEVLETAVSRGYQQAMTDSELKIVSKGEIQDLKFDGPQTDMTFTVVVEIQPEIDLKKYKELAVEKEKVVVTDEMIQEALENIRQSYATVKSAEKAEEGHLVTLSIQELGEGDMPIVGRKYDDVKVKLGSGQFDEDMEKQMIGLTENEERIIRRKTEPKEGETDGKTESYKVTATAVEEQELPAIDDELAKNLGEENINTLDELKKYLNEQMEHRMTHHAEQHLTQHLIDELLKENPFDVPEAMVDNYINYVIEDLKRQNPKAKIDTEIVRQNHRVEGIHAIRWHLLKDKIRQVENIEVSDEEAFERVDKAGFSPEDVEMLKSNPEFLRRIKDDMIDDKVIKFLKENAKITEVDPPETPKFTAQVDNPAE
ncbi:MAG: trigger factor [Calditrichia bacterium]